MKIVHLIGYFQPEFGYKEYYLARNQVKLGHDVFVITSNRIYPFYNLSELAKKINISPERIRPAGLSTIDGINVYRLPTVLEFKGAILIKGVKKLLKEIKPDIVHTYEPVQITPFLGAWYKDKNYFLIADHQQFELPRTILGKIYFYSFSRFLSQYVLNKADKIIFATSQSRKFTEQRFKFKADKIMEIPLGFDCDFFHFDPAARREIRNYLAIKDDDILLVTAGRIEKDKQYELVFQALRQINNIKFLIIGSGDNSYLKSLNNLEKNLGLQGKIIYHDFVNKKDLYKYYSASDLGIWPDLPSITIIEAIGCQLPVILPERDTVSHLVKGGNGLLFKRNNKEDLARILANLINNRGLLDQLRQRTRLVAEEQFDYLKIAQKIVGFYSQLINKFPQP